MEKFGAHVVEATNSSVTIQQTASPAQTQMLLNELAQFGIMELTQSGVVAMGRSIQP
ncbi:MAG: hypothetical protein ACKN9O_05690 [Actinomycetota bacterium]